jgi:hypothetical protein
LGWQVSVEQLSLLAVAVIPVVMVDPAAMILENHQPFHRFHKITKPR